MKIVVCPLSKVISIIDFYAPELIVSLLDPDCAFPETGPTYSNRHLRLCFHDIDAPIDGQVAPGIEHVDELLAFLSQWSHEAPILIHCRAGISRSTAAAFITACLHNPHVDELEIANALRRAAPLARPNGALIKLADTVMGRNGRMNKAITESGRNLPWIEIDEGVPFEMPAIFESAL